MLRLGLWLIGRCTVEIFADGKSLGRRRIVDVEPRLARFDDEEVMRQP
jgi:hypothetical protein